MVASFNVLGADHTDGRHGRRGFDTSDVRLARAITVLRRTSVDIVGLQEFQRPQYDRFLARVGDRWAVYAGAEWDTDNSIAWRTDRIERNVTRRLTRQEHAPVFMTGDMNDRAEFFCPFTRNRVMRSFLGGSHPEDGRCQAPASGVDWIFANNYVEFGDPRIDRSPLVAATTDHPVVSTHVRLR